MVQPETQKSPFDGSGFIVAAMLAPGMAVAIFIVGIALAGPFVEPGEIGRLIGAFLLMLLIVSVWGIIPSLVFGGLVLAGIGRIPWRGRPTAVVFMIGGVAAACLYVLTGLGIAELSPGVAMFFAPWATPELRGSSPSGEEGWLVASLLLAGAAAGLIYSAFAKRG
ncbi:hypothetical protein [Brevundimonas sp.]|uniref:hypothetical protein n=1 Tax=Brevundimonas sp. TaxID=1871086 RepID=UPI003F6F1B45